MDNFIKPIDDLSALIDEQAQILYKKLFSLPVYELNFAPVPLEYYLARHHERKFFSVQTAAEMLYRSIKMKGKPLSELTIMEYGAGLGSLYLLSKMIGVKTVVYNDILQDMKDAAMATANYLQIPIDIFIAGDHKPTLAELKEKGIECDIILSRNVVEHIYDLNEFYYDMSVGQPNALIYFSTTANFHNPATVWYHKGIHRKYEKQFLQTRKKIILSQLNELPEEEANSLASATRGLAVHDLDNAIKQYASNKTLPNPARFYTNTCDPECGQWYEQVIPVSDYKKIIESKGYKLTVLPAFWDTHYSSAIKNVVGKTMNFITNLLGNNGGLATTAFIYIIAEKK